MAIAPSNSLVANLMEADSLTTTAKKALTDLEVGFYPNNAAVAARKVDLDIRAVEDTKQQTYITLHNGVDIP